MSVSDWSSDVCSSDLPGSYHFSAKKIDLQPPLANKCSTTTIGQKQPTFPPSLALYNHWRAHSLLQVTLLTSIATDSGASSKTVGHFLPFSFDKAKFTIRRHQLLHAWWFPPCLASNLTSFGFLTGLSSPKIAHSTVKIAVKLGAKG